MLVCADEATCFSIVDGSNPVLVLVVEGLDAIGTGDDVLTLVYLEIHVAAY